MIHPSGSGSEVDGIGRRPPSWTEENPRAIHFVLLVAGLAALAWNHREFARGQGSWAAVLVLAPFAVAFGLAGVIDPRIPRAVTRFHEQAPPRARGAAVVFGAIALVVALLLALVVYPR